VSREERSAPSSSPVPAPAAGPKDRGAQRDLESLMQEYTNYRGYADAVRQQIDVLSGAVTELALSKAAIEEVRSRGGKGETLIHIGAGNYIRVQLQDVKTVIAGVGAGVLIEKTLDDAISEIESRSKRAQEQIAAAQNQLLQVTSRMDELQGRIDQLYMQSQSQSQSQQQSPSRRA